MEVHTMTREALLERLHNLATEIIDKRWDWKDAKFKIVGARLHDPDRVEFGPRITVKNRPWPSTTPKSMNLPTGMARHLVGAGFENDFALKGG